MKRYGVSKDGKVVHLPPIHKEKIDGKKNHKENDGKKHTPENPKHEVVFQNDNYPLMSRTKKLFRKNYTIIFF